MVDLAEVLAEIQVSRGLPDRAADAIARADGVRAALLPLSWREGGAGTAPVG